VVAKLVVSVWGNVAWHNWGTEPGSSRKFLYCKPSKLRLPSVLGVSSMTQKLPKDAIVQNRQHKCMENGKNFPDGDKVRGVDRQNQGKKIW
jgi:hypothetical protein